ncbi:type II toxin-antitoxin system prevent-host-death family antitoxin [Sphingomonas sp. S-NIH.Pt15_0812]|uniref:type II toxin-antitoxin system Phd/YefM family antitoxin n=1 Tax=Sphingomonas sp. S-NIH.Pt15_0812 TaxID=1920129 RepID=UPI000F7E67D7|nr:type II toxin-antitoxin system prevent-host-death family antitoxin [Sphingomonas sp. S-NIH.Pt15_0812]RSU54090.1 prevent-host-death protein [Sphingomonas sp. S-NIH.Pt15_0812]
MSRRSTGEISRRDSISISEARADFKSVVERGVADRAPLAITRKKAEGVVLIADSEWASIKETLYLLYSPNNAKRLLESIAGYKLGEQAY